jgi:hypothetical protein
MLKKVSSTNPRDARLAVPLRRTLLSPQENSSLQLALVVAKKLRFPSSPAMTDPFIAATATLK